MEIDLTLVFLGIMVFSAHLFSYIFKKRMIPDVLLLMIIGLLLGPVLMLVEPGAFGKVGPVFATITLVLILFEGGTSLSLKSMQLVWKSTMTLTAAGFFVSLIVITVIAWAFFGFSLNGAFLLGAILGGTSSAVVIPLVGKLIMGDETRTVLILESALTDVLCIVFTLAFMEVFKLGELRIGLIFGQILSSFILAGVIGFACALVWSRIIAKIRKIQNSIFTTPAFIFVVYGITELLGYSGAISALVFGITMANLETFRHPLIVRALRGKSYKLNEVEMTFFSEIVFLLKTFFFVYIGISMVLDNVDKILMGIIITLVLYFVRFFIAKYASPKTATSFDKSVASIMTPKGLAAAVLATLPLQEGHPEGAAIKDIAFAVVFASIVLTSILILLLSKSNKVKTLYNSFYGSKTVVADVEYHKGIENEYIDIQTENESEGQ